MDPQLLQPLVIACTQLNKQATGLVEFCTNFSSILNSLNPDLIKFDSKHPNIYASAERLEELNKMDKAIELISDFIEFSDDLTECSMNINIAAVQLRNKLILSCKE
jgi:hypothetical protein